MQQAASVISFCTISNTTVVHNGCTVLESGAAGMQAFFTNAYRHLGADYPRFFKMDNLCKLGFLASEYLLQGLPGEHRPAPGTAVVLANANASLDTDEKYFQSIATGASPSLFVYTLPSIVIGEICIRNKFKGQGAFFVAETFDAAFMELYVNDLFARNSGNHCICGWVDVLNDACKAVLFLVAPVNSAGLMAFTQTNMQRIFETV